MRRFLFVLFSIAALFYLLKTLRIVTYDMDRLTDYGQGYLAGMLIMFVLFTALAVGTLLRIRKHKDSESHSF